VRTLLAFALLGLVVASVAVQAQSPAGGEFRVNDATAAGDISAGVAADASGAFVVTWTDGSTAPAVRARQYDPRGVPRGAPFTVSPPSGFPREPAVASDDRGRTMMVFERDEIGVARLWGRVFDPSGQPLGSEFQVSDPGYSATYPALAVSSAARFLVAWESASGIRARHFGPAGNPRGVEFAVSTAAGENRRPTVAANSGRFIIAWTNEAEGHRDVLARRVDGLTPSGLEFRANTYTTGDQDSAMVVVGDQDFWHVLWLDHRQFPGAPTFVGRTFDRFGPLSPEFVLGNSQSGPYSYPASVTSDQVGHFTVVWERPDGSSQGIFGRRFRVDGSPRGAEFRVNTSTAADQVNPHVAADRSGNLFAVWQSTQNGVMPEIYGQRFGGLVSAGLRMDDGPGGNGVLELGESMTLSPSWRNVSGGAQTFQGRASDIRATPGVLVTWNSFDAVYGTVADGAVGTCTTTCYTAAVSGPILFQHRDVFFVENLTPDVQGQTLERRIHVGGSFADVPRTSPFYRFVETAVHNSITGGCAAAVFCPLNHTAREQLAVMALTGKEGPGYDPPRCGVPRFDDVSPSSPFCPFVEELARRGVVGGCDGRNFCPTAPVTREQLSVIILRLLDPSFTPPACTTPRFNDVPASSPFCRWIEELARRGVVSGCGNSNFCPTQEVTREQMTVFISVAFGLTLSGP
jgi:hypothetical protein